MRYIALVVAALVACDTDTVAPTRENMDPEIALEIPDQVVPLKGLAIRLGAHFADPDGDVLTYTVASDDPSYIGAEVRASSLVLRQLAISPGSSATITVTATDADAGTVGTSFLATGSMWLHEDWENGLGEWELNKDRTSPVYCPEPGCLDSAKAVVDAGLLYLYPASNQPIQAGAGVAKDIPTINDGWTIRASAALSSDLEQGGTCLVIDAYTGHHHYKMLRFVFDQISSDWRLYLATAETRTGPGRGDLLWFFVLTGGAVPTRWNHYPRRELIDASVSFVDGVLTIGRNGKELASFDPLKLGLAPPDLDEGWPPSELPPSLAKIGIRNFPGCGPNPPERGRVREFRNTLVVDWIQVLNEGGSG